MIERENKYGEGQHLEIAAFGQSEYDAGWFCSRSATPEQFMDCHELFFEKILDIHATDISGIEGYGWFDEACRTEYATCRDYLIDTFAEDKEGYWYNWREMFETTLLERDFFETYYKEMEARIPY